MLLRHIPGPSSGLRAASLLFKANPASPSAAAAAAAFTPFAQGRRPLVTRSPAFSPTTPALFSTSSFRSRPSSADSEADVQCPLLEPPWQLTDLKRHEQEAWKKHGTAMFEEVPMQHYARQSLERIELRRAAAKRLEQEHGPNWYAILSVAKRLRDADRAALSAEDTTLEPLVESRRLEAETRNKLHMAKTIGDNAETKKLWDTLSGHRLESRKIWREHEAKRFARYIELAKQEVGATAEE